MTTITQCCQGVYTWSLLIRTCSAVFYDKTVDDRKYVELTTTSITTRVVYGYPFVHGAFFLNRKSYGPVRCGFKKSEISRCGSMRFSDIASAVRCCRISYGAVRCGFEK